MLYDFLQRVKSATKECLISFAIKYGVVSALPLLSYQHRVYLGSDSRMILNRLELEVITIAIMYACMYVCMYYLYISVISIV